MSPDVPPAGFEPHDRRSPLTAPWAEASWADRWATNGVLRKLTEHPIPDVASFSPAPPAPQRRVGGPGAADAAPGSKVNTTPTDFFPVKQMQLTRFDGTQAWVLFGDIIG